MTRRRNMAAPKVVWDFTGLDSTGAPVSLVVDETSLLRAHVGLTVGRHAQLCDFLLSDDTISQRQFRLVRTADGIMIEDLNSLNGTYADGWRLEPFQVVPLRDGMALAAGHVQLTVTRQQRT